MTREHVVWFLIGALAYYAYLRVVRKQITGNPLQPAYAMAEAR